MGGFYGLEQCTYILSMAEIHGEIYRYVHSVDEAQWLGDLPSVAQLAR